MSETKLVEELDVSFKVDLINKLQKLRMLRMHRITASKKRVPGYLITMLACMTASMIVPFFIQQLLI